MRIPVNGTGILAINLPALSSAPFVQPSLSGQNVDEDGNSIAGENALEVDHLLTDMVEEEDDDGNDVPAMGAAALDASNRDDGKRLMSLQLQPSLREERSISHRRTLKHFGKSDLAKNFLLERVPLASFCIYCGHRRFCIDLQTTPIPTLTGLPIPFAM